MTPSQAVEHVKRNFLTIFRRGNPSWSEKEFQWLSNEIITNIMSNGVLGTGHGYSLFHAFAEIGHEHAVQLLVEKGANRHATTTQAWTAVHCAAWKGHAMMVRVLLEHGIDVNAKCNMGGVRHKNEWTALHLAAWAGHEPVVHILLEHGANLDIKLLDGSIALDIAERVGHDALIHLFTVYRRDSEV